MLGLPPLPADAQQQPFPLLSTLARYTCCRAAYFLSVRGLLSLADDYQPGLIISQLSLSVVRRSHLMDFYMGFPRLQHRSNLFNSFMRFVVFDALCTLGVLFLALFDKSGSLRLCLASRRLGEVCSCASLISVFGYQLVPKMLIRLASFPAEDLDPEIIYSIRRDMTSQQLSMEWTVPSLVDIVKYVIGFTCLEESTCAHHRTFHYTQPCCWSGVALRLADTIAIPQLALTLGCWLGRKLRARTTAGDIRSGTMYNTAYWTMYVASNVWLVMGTRLFSNRLQLQSRWALRHMHMEVDRLDLLYRHVFEGRSDEQVHAIRRELERTVGGDAPDRPVRLQGGNWQTEVASAKELLASLERQDRRMQLVLKRVRANLKPAIFVECEGKTCCVCLLDFEEGMEVSRLKCNHFFCSSCIELWLVKKNFCPVCKAVVLTRRPILQTVLSWTVRILQCMMVAGPRLMVGDGDFVDVFLCNAAQRFFGYGVTAPPQEAAV